jgi:hypothetical protein
MKLGVRDGVNEFFDFLRASDESLDGDLGLSRVDAGEFVVAPLCPIAPRLGQHLELNGWNHNTSNGLPL